MDFHGDFLFKNSFMADLPKGHPKLLNAWAFYDWANSVYSLVIASAVFPIFYEMIFKESGRNYVTVFGMQCKDTAMISFVTAFAFLIVALFSPILSGIADYIGNKEAFLRFFCYLGAISCICLYWFDLNQLFLTLMILLQYMTPEESSVMVIVILQMVMMVLFLIQ